MKAYNPQEVLSPPIVLDCEASGFGPKSYPIEVGFVIPSGEVFSYLIRPEPQWTFWNDESEKVHNIPRQQLFDEGLPALEVAQKLNSQLRDITVYSDAPDFESFWLSRLFLATQMDAFFDVDHLFHAMINHQHKYFYEFKKELRACDHITAHRAGDDAWVLQQAFLRSRQKAVDLHHK